MSSQSEPALGSGLGLLAKKVGTAPCELVGCRVQGAGFRVESVGCRFLTTCSGGAGFRAGPSRQEGPSVG